MSEVRKLAATLVADIVGYAKSKPGVWFARKDEIEPLKKDSGSPMRSERQTVPGVLPKNGDYQP